MELRKEKADLLDVELKLSRKEVSDMRAVVADQKTRLDTASGRRNELRIRCVEPNASPATCRKELIHVEKNFSAAFEKMMVALVALS